MLPLLEIAPKPPTPQTLPSLKDLARVDYLIFVSANAVESGLAYLPVIPGSITVGTIGQATAERLQEAGIHPTLVPAHFDSEDLRDKTVMIVRGEGGREKLAESLRARGAQVQYLEAYRRACPHWQQQDVRTALCADIITVTSGEALENLTQLAQLPGGEAL